MKVIGGYFGLEPYSRSIMPPWIDECIQVQSGRMALLLEITKRMPKIIWLPYYYCDAVSCLLKKSGYSVDYYTLREDFSIVMPHQFSSEDLLVFVDYFGISGDSVRRDINSLGLADNAVVDACMSLWFDIDRDVPIFYSPRKFIGVPDGGWLRNSKVSLNLAREKMPISQIREAHLHSRAGGNLEKGRDEFTTAEKSFNDDLSPNCMSATTKKMISSVDFDGVFNKRISNYTYLKSGLESVGLNCPEIPSGACPLCCPVKYSDAANLKMVLMTEQIYCPHYWPDIVVPSYDKKSLELLNKTLFLPIDHRYTSNDMDKIIQVIEGAIK